MTNFSNNSILLNVHRFKKIYLSISANRRFGFVLLFSLIAISSIFEIATLASLIPFISFIASPSTAAKFKFFEVLSSLGVNYNPQSSLLYASISFVFLLTISSVLRLLCLRQISRYSALIGNDLCSHAYKNLLYLPFSLFQEIPSSVAISTLTTHTLRTVQSIFALLNIVNSLVNTFVIAAFLLFINPIIMLVSFFLFAIAYIVVSRFISKRLTYNSQLIANNTDTIVKLIQNTFASAVTFTSTILSNLRLEILPRLTLMLD